LSFPLPSAFPPSARTEILLALSSISACQHDSFLRLVAKVAFQKSQQLCRSMSYYSTVLITGALSSTFAGRLLSTVPSSLDSPNQQILPKSRVHMSCRSLLGKQWKTRSIKLKHLARNRIAISNLASATPSCNTPVVHVARSNANSAMANDEKDRFPDPPHQIFEIWIHKPRSSRLSDPTQGRIVKVVSCIQALDEQ
jgi:hypothetical protein